MSDDRKNHLIKSLNANFRYDGRNLTQYRDIKVEYGVAKNAEGSALVKIGKTEVMAGVKFETGEPYPDIPDQGTMMFGAELLPLSSPDFESGPPGEFAIELARVVDRGIRESGAIDTKKLCIVPNEKVWIIVVDIVTINDDGNIWDAASLAALAALRNAKFPKLDENNRIIYKEKTDKELPLIHQPLEVTILKIGNHLIMDPSKDEEEMMDSRLTVAIKEDGSICALQKGGNDPLTSEEINKMVEMAIEKTNELRTHL